MIWPTSGCSISLTTGFPVREKHILITICKLFQAEMSRKAVIRFEIERYLKVDRIKFKVIYFYRHISRIVSVEN